MSFETNRTFYHHTFATAPSQLANVPSLLIQLQFKIVPSLLTNWKSARTYVSCADTFIILKQLARMIHAIVHYKE